ncbi:hypothetical protein, partial [Amycolatopsis sp. KNN50.9b]|uniref:hypothetical protein n=1 Tax=Amycolatopsis sp. KNN50.9b TaxID=2018303 RepID=UPI000B9D30B4
MAEGEGQFQDGFGRCEVGVAGLGTQVLPLPQLFRLMVLVVVLDSAAWKSSGRPVLRCSHLSQRLDLLVVVASFGAGVDAEIDAVVFVVAVEVEGAGVAPLV